MEQVNYREIANKIVTKGARGVSNKQMLDTIRDVFDGKFEDVDQTTAFKALYMEYKSIFESSCKYVVDEQKVILEKFLQEQPGGEDIKLNIGKRTRHMMNMGVNPLDEDAKEQLEAIEAAEEKQFEISSKLNSIVKKGEKWKSVLTEEEVNAVITAVETKDMSNIDEIETILEKIA